MRAFAVTPPRTRGEIVEQLERLHDDSMQFYTTLSTADFIAPQGTAWSPADHVRHLTKSIRAVNRGLRIPRLVLWWKFGRAHRPSRPYVEVVREYRQRLETFDGRRNPFAPAPRDPTRDAEQWRSEVMRYHGSAAGQLIEGVQRWSEPALDRYQAPHPLLGKMTFRELLFFTLYHNLHHVLLISSRTPQADRAT